MRQGFHQRMQVLLWGLPLFVAACGTPVGVSRVSQQAVDQRLTASALTGTELSASSWIVLSRHHLLDDYKRAPDEALARLHRIYAEGERAGNEAFALAELAFLSARETRRQSYYFASALYAYAFLFPESPEDVPSPFDRRFRQACDIYNRALANALKSEDGQTVEPRAGSYALPFSRLEVEFRDEQLLWHRRRLDRFIPVAELEIHGIRNHYRVPGIGAPLAAGQTPVGEEEPFPVPPHLKVPVTALLRVEHPREQLASGTVHASLELHVALDTMSVEIGGRTVPLEVETTGFLAATLQEPGVWAREFKGFFMGDLATRTARAQLGPLEPYKPGRFPVVFVHGTVSSPGRWADMVNDLMNDPGIRHRFQIWGFTYNTGNPVAFSAMQFREELEKAIQALSPDGSDPALQHVVVVGHSLGGLLAKMTVVETRDRLWNSISRKPLDQMNIPEFEKAMFRRALFLKPLPFVRRVVFIATPHRGSFLAKTWIGEFLGNLVQLPGTMVTLFADVFAREREAFLLDPSSRTLGVGFGLTPGNPVMNALSRIPVAPGVAAHSIIAVKGSGPVEEGDDGVVEYTSAHLDDVDSEKVVRSAHSTQSDPETIEEVRRILLLHVAEWCERAVPCATSDGVTAEPR